MNEWGLVLLLLFITIIAAAVMVYPLKSNRYFTLLLAPLIVVFSLAGYYFWGDFANWQEYLKHNESQQRVQQMLKTIKTPQELIAKLKAKLDDTPKSAKGWYLLGRLYSAQKEFEPAVQAFAKAYAFAPDNEQYAVNYAQGLWQLNQHQFNPEIINLFSGLLHNNPKQADALAMLAMHAFMSHAYQDAIDYWQRLLQLAPEQSEESLAIRKAIAKAQARIKNKEGSS